MAQSLEEFAAAEQRANRCFFCGIAEADEINKGKASGVTMAAIRRWLIDQKKYSPADVSEERLRKHFRSGHHERSVV